LKKKTKIAKQQNLSLNESASIQYGALALTWATAVRRWIRDWRWTVCRQIISTSSSAGL